MLKVSICIPTYNSETYLEQSLISIENQTYSNIEVIISDNCSKDGTAEIIKKFAAKNNWKYVLNEENIGAGLNMNKLVSLATGDLIAIYHSDDLYDPEIVSKSVAFLQENKDCGFVSTLATLIDSNGKYTGELDLPASLAAKGTYIFDFKELFSAILDSFVPFLITPSVMVPKAIYDELGDFLIHGKYKSAGDYEMWLRISKKYSVGIIPEKLLKYRKHANQGSQLEIRENYGLPDGLIVYEEYAKGDKFLEGKYKRAYSWLLFLQVLKLNNVRKYKESSGMVGLIQQHGNLKYKLLTSVFNLLNLSSIRFNINYLNSLKKLVVKAKAS